MATTSAPVLRLAAPVAMRSAPHAELGSALLRLSVATLGSARSPFLGPLGTPSPLALAYARSSSLHSRTQQHGAGARAAISTGVPTPETAQGKLRDSSADTILKNLRQVPLPWQWQPGHAVSSSPISIRGVEFQESTGYPAASSATSGSPTLLLLPALSDVAAVEEWQAVAACLLASESCKPQDSALGPLLLGQAGTAEGDAAEAQLRVIAVDWPGFGGSGCPPLLYTADLLEDFLVDYVAHLFPVGQEKVTPLVLVGAGHAASIALRAVSKGRISPAALVAVAPTWGGPLPIVFGNDEKMAFRYGLLRSALRSPGVGWALYRYLTTPKMMKMQYMTHVYADPDNISPGLVEARTALTQREGGRFAPASFLTGLLDPVKSREDWLAFFESAGKRGVPVGVLAAAKSPKRSRREMESLQRAPGVAFYEQVPGALLPQEEYPEEVAAAIEAFFSTPAFRRVPVAA